MNMQMGKQVQAHVAHAKAHKAQHKQIEDVQKENLKLNAALSGLTCHHVNSMAMPHVLAVPHMHDVGSALKSIMG